MKTFIICRYLPSAIGIVTSNKVRWTGYVARVGRDNFFAVGVKGGDTCATRRCTCDYDIKMGHKNST
jgi:hypothetical protein